MAWLGTWKYRRKITIAAADVDAALSDFPIRVSLSILSGKGITDVSDIFDEIGSNSLKIAVTEDDEVTETYVEVEYWDLGTERAELWVKVPSVSSSVATDIYLYYDNNKVDNTTYVGVVNSTPGGNVWDSNFVGVWHLAETAGNYLDSTSNSNDSNAIDVTNRTTAGLITPNSPHYENANTNVGITIPDSVGLRLTDKTLEAFVEFESFIPAEFPDVIYHRDGVTSSWYGLEITNDPYEVRHRWSGSFQDYATDIESELGFVYLAATVDTGTTTATGYKNDNIPAVNSSITNPTAGGATSTYFGDPTGSYLDGTLDEIRISNIARPEAWIDATHKTLNDNFISWAIQEQSPSWGHTINSASSPGKVNTVAGINITEINTT